MSQQEHQVAMGVYEYQPPAVLDQGAPVQNTWYTILSATRNVRIKMINVHIADTNETLEVRMTKDGEVIDSAGFAATQGVSYPINFHADAITLTDLLEFDDTPVQYAKYRSFLAEGKLVKVEVRKTTAAGVGNLTGIVTYTVKKPAT